MTETSARLSPKLLARSIRIITGLILLGFVTCHLLNASLGLISIEAMDAARPYMTTIWSFPPLGPLLALSLVAHFLLGLWSVYERPSFRSGAQDVLQIVTALCVVPLMATHVIGVAMAGQAGLHFEYADAIRAMWIDLPGVGLLQVILVTVIWLHGCAGLLVWLRSVEAARNVIMWVYPVVIAVPVLALLGFSEAGRQVLEAAPASAEVTAGAYQADTGSGGSSGGYETGYGSGGSTSGGYGAEAQSYNSPTGAESETARPAPQVDFAQIQAVTTTVIWGSILMAGLTLLARAVRLWLQPNRPLYATLNDRALAPTTSGGSLLDIFRAQSAPHASLCQGRGRCGTCAVRVISSEFPLRPASQLERRTLFKKGLPEDARLACQVLPDGGKIVVEALYPADYTHHAIDDQETTPPDPTSPTDTGPVSA